jgi:copper(I)-binding protein
MSSLSGLTSSEVALHRKKGQGANLAQTLVGAFPGRRKLRLQRKKMKTISLALLSFLLLIAISACSGNDQTIIQDAWARPGFVGDNSAVYFVLTNPSDSPDNLIDANTDTADMVEIHLSKMDSAGVMTMERQDLIVIPANEKLEFSPGGLHVMLISLLKDLAPGDSFPLTLSFQNAGDITVEVEVRQP